jgi:hypothetical protein
MHDYLIPTVEETVLLGMIILVTWGFVYLEDICAYLAAD